jgi:hypothetical protein
VKTRWAGRVVDRKLSLISSTTVLSTLLIYDSKKVRIGVFFTLLRKLSGTVQTNLLDMPYYGAWGAVMDL